MILDSMLDLGWGSLPVGLQDKILRQLADKLNLEEIKKNLSGLDDKLIDEFFKRVDVQKLADELKDELSEYLKLEISLQINKMMEKLTR